MPLRYFLEFAEILVSNYLFVLTNQELVRLSFDSDD